MKQFWVIQLKQNILYLVLLLLAPMIITALICFLVKNEIGTKQFDPWSKHEIPQQLPAVLGQYPLAYAPQNADTDKLARQIADELGIKDIFEFPLEQNMRDFFIASNILPGADKKLQQFEDDIIQMKDSFQFQIDQDQLHTFLTTTYKQNHYNVLSTTHPAQTTFIGISFDLTPQKINYTVHYNRQMIENYSQNTFDLFTSYFLPHDQKTFSPYGFTIQQAIEKQFIKAKRTYKLSAMNYVNTFNMPDSNLYLLSYAFPSAAAPILYQILVAEIRAQYYRMVKKLGGSDIMFWGVIYSAGVILITLTIFLQMLIAYAFNIQPFGVFTIETMLFFSFIASLPATATCCIIGVIIESNMIQIIVSVGISVGFTIMPLFISNSFSGDTGRYSSLWDAEQFPQPIIWIFIFLWPPLTYYATTDIWATLHFGLFVKDEGFAKNVINIFNKNLYNIKADSSAISATPYNIPFVGGMVAVIVIQFILVFLLVLYLCKILSQSSYVGLPWNFLFQKQFYSALKLKKQCQDDKAKNSLFVNSINKSFKSTKKCKKQAKQVLADIQFEAHDNQVVGLMGCTGSGKTTACKIIQHALKPDLHTEIRYGSFELSSPYASFHSGIVASCPQDKSNLMFNASVTDNIKVCKEYVKWFNDTYTIDQYIDLLLEKLKLKKHQKKKYTELSGGMQRRLSLLIALLQIPQILVLDEITANVDPQLKHDIWQILQEYQKMFHRIIIMTSHDSYELQYMCSMVIHIENGKIVQQDSVVNFVKNNIGADHQLSINEIIYKDDVQVIESSQTTTTTRDELKKNQKQHQINTLAFAFKKRWYWHFNNKFLLLIVMILLNVFFGAIFKIFVTQEKYVPKPAEEREFYIKNILPMNMVIDQNTFEDFLLNKNQIQISQFSPASMTSAQCFKDSFTFDQLYGQQLTFGDYSMFVGTNELQNQTIHYIINKSISQDPLQQFDEQTKIVQCSSFNIELSQIRYQCTGIDKDFPRVTQLPDSSFQQLATFVNFQSLRQSKDFMYKHQLGEKYKFNINSFSQNDFKYKLLGNPLSITDVDSNEVTFYINTPPIQMKFDQFEDNALLMLQYSNAMVLPQIPQTFVKNGHYLVNYQNDAMTRFNAKTIRQEKENNLFEFQANFYQQPQFYSQNFSSFYSEHAKAGELALSYFFSLAVGLIILIIIYTFHNDSQQALRNQLEAVGISQTLLTICQVFVDQIQILLIEIIFFIVFVCFENTSQYSFWQIYIAFIIESICHSMLLQIYMLIFKKLAALVLFLSIIFAFSLFTVAFINVEMQNSLILSLFLPGYFYAYLIKASGRMLSYNPIWLLYGILVNIGEITIGVIVIYIKGRKKKTFKHQDHLLKAEHVSAGYGKTRILHDINVDICENDSLALIGNNGCGKTTFIKCVLHQLKYQGLLETINDIAIIPQDDIIFQKLTVKQYFKTFNTYSQQLIDELNLNTCLNQKYEELSGGQQRRLTIALILSTNPRLVMLDEITVGSDYIMKNLIWHRLNSIVGTKVVISHDMNEIQKHAKRVCFVKNGIGRMITQHFTGYLFIVYQNTTQIQGFKQFFDKQTKQCEEHEKQKIFDMLVQNNQVFTVEQNGLEKLFVDEYEFENDDIQKSGQESPILKPIEKQTIQQEAVPYSSNPINTQ